MTTEEALVAYESGKPMNVEPGIYPATVDALDEIDGQFGLQWRFTFKLNEFPEELPWAWASAKLGTKTKLYRWATALLGRPLAIGERLVRAELVGKPCNVIIKEKPDMEAEGGVRRYVDDILGVKKAAAKAKAAGPLDDACFCGKPVSSYTPDGRGLCEEHAKQASE